MTTTLNTSNLPLPLLGKQVPSPAKRALRMLQSLQVGGLHLQLPDGQTIFFGHTSGPQATLQLHNWQVFGAALRSGDIGFAQSFIAGDWDTPDLTALLQLWWSTGGPWTT